MNNTPSETSPEMFRALVVDALESMIVTDEELTITFQNKATERMTGFSSAQRIGRDLPEFVHPDDRSPLVTAVHRVRANQGPSPVLQFRIRHVDRGWIPVEAVVRLIETEGASRVLFYVRDTVERRHLQTRLRHAQKLTALGRLALGLADDFETAVSTIRTHANTLVGQEATGRTAFGLRAILKATDTAGVLVQQLKAFVDMVPVFPDRVDVHGMLAGLRQALSEDAWIDVTLDAVHTVVRTDRDRLWQGLADLIVACRRQSLGGIVTVQTDNLSVAVQQAKSALPTASLDYVGISIGCVASSEDEGPASLFEPHEVTSSSGLMLALVSLHDISTAAGGFVEVAGADIATVTRATIYLPIEGNDPA